MRTFFLLLAAPLALAGCGADVEAACEAYFDAVEACSADYVESAGGTATPLGDDYCAIYAGATDQTSADLLNCQADAYNNADCTTSEGYTAAGTDAAACATK